MITVFVLLLKNSHYINFIYLILTYICIVTYVTIFTLHVHVLTEHGDLERSIKYT